MAIADLIIIRDEVGSAAPIILTPDMAADPETWADAWAEAQYSPSEECMTAARDLAGEIAASGLSHRTDDMGAYLGVDVSRVGREYGATDLAGIVSELTWRRPMPGEWTVTDGTGRVLMTVHRTRHSRLPWAAELIDGDAVITGRTRHEAAVLALALASLLWDAADRLVQSLSDLREAIDLVDWEEPHWDVLPGRDDPDDEARTALVASQGHLAATVEVWDDGLARCIPAGGYRHTHPVSQRQAVASVWDLIAPRR